MFDAGDGVDYLLDSLGHLPLHRLRRGPGELGDDGQDRDFHIGVHIDGQAPVGKDPEGDQGQHHYRGKDGTLDG